MKDIIIGIDLGTATTEAAVYLDGKVQMIPNPNGDIVTPSVIGVDESGNFIIGEKAKAQYIMAPERTAIEVKRKLGTTEQIRLGKRSFTPVELSAKLLEYVRGYTSEYLDADITRAVISVPAYFDDIQRQAVVEAGKKAGFTVERIINEPTAAALSYGIDHMEEESHILVYDLGGGTFDVTLLEMFGGVLEVKASSGDNALGGKDFDQCLIDLMEGHFRTAHGISLNNKPYAMARLKTQAENCKVTLSSQEEAQVHIPLLAEQDHVPLGLEDTISRSQFEELAQDLLDRTRGPIQVVLEDSGVGREELDMVLLVGGSTRMPMVAASIQELLGMEPKREVDPDYSVAQGAAIQAAIISGAIDSDDSIVMTDVNPYTLGIRTVSGLNPDYMSVIIPRNVTIPVTKHQTYYTTFDFQTEAVIDVYQGESRTASKNHRLGTFTLTGIPAAPATEESIDVSFSYNQDGMLDVSASITSTGKEASIVIDLMHEAEAPMDVSSWKSSPIAGDYRSIIRRGEKFLKRLQGEGSGKLGQELGDLLYRLKKAVLEEDSLEADELEEEIEVFMEEEG